MKTDNKKIALDFLKMVIAGKIDAAYEKYVDMKGRHHNTYFGMGFPLLLNAMKENHAKFPTKKLTVKHTLLDGDLVATHSHLAFKEGESGMVVVHIFRIKDGKIVEMWDCGQEIPANCPNKDGAF